MRGTKRMKRVRQVVSAGLLEDGARGGRLRSRRRLLPLGVQSRYPVFEIVLSFIHQY